MDRDQQPGSPWRPETDAEALTASGAWPTPLDALKARSGLAQVKRTLEAAQPPEPRLRASLRQREQQAASG